MNPEFVLENETHKILWDFEIQTNLLIPARQPYLLKVNNNHNTTTTNNKRVPVE